MPRTPEQAQQLAGQQPGHGADRGKKAGVWREMFAGYQPSVPWGKLAVLVVMLGGTIASDTLKTVEPCGERLALGSFTTNTQIIAG